MSVPERLPARCAPLPRLPLAAALCAAAAGGVLLALAFPGRGWWPLAFPGIALLIAGLPGRRGPAAFLVGAGGGLACYLSLIPWSAQFLGPIPYLALSVFCAAWWGASGTLTALALRGIERRFREPTAAVLAPIAIAGLWIMREGVLSTWPYGGFAWGRVAQSQSASPFAELVSWLGLAGLGALMVWSSAACALPLMRLLGAGAADAGADARLPRPRKLPRWEPLAAAACGTVLLALVPVFPVRHEGTIRVAAVQGGTPQAAYFIPNERGEVLAAHLAATREHVPQDAQPELVLWPEGSVDASPVYDPAAALSLRMLSERYDAPIVANTVTIRREGGQEHYYNSSFLWTAENGWGAQYDKQHPVPFGEYIPHREFYRALAPELVDLVARGYTPGTGPVAMPLAGTSAGTFICFDIVDDRLVTTAVGEQGAQWLFAPTNNADFGDTDELSQQLAFARLRAIETGRAIVQVSTVGDSAVYAPDGRELASLQRFRPGAMIVDVPLSSGLTPATRFGRAIELLAGGTGAVLLLGSLAGGRSRPGLIPPGRDHAWPAGS